MIALSPPPAAESHWFDLARRFRQRLILPENPINWTHFVEVDFSSGCLRDVADLTVGDGARRLFDAESLASHPDGSVARARLTIPVSRFFERRFPAWTDVYYGVEPDWEGAGGGPGQVVSWNAEKRRVATTWYVIDFDAAGSIARLIYRPCDMDALGPRRSMMYAMAESARKAVRLAGAKPPARFEIRRPADNGSAALEVEAISESPLGTLRRVYRFAPAFLRIDFRFEAARDVRRLAPAIVHHPPFAGRVVGPEGRVESAAADREVAASDARPGWIFSSQTGYFAWWSARDSAPAPTRFVFDPDQVERGVEYGSEVGFFWENLAKGQAISGTLNFAFAPHVGDFGRERLAETIAQLESPSRSAVRVEPEETRPAAFAPAVVSGPDGSRCLEVANLRFRVRLGAKGRHGFLLETRDGRPFLAAERPWGFENAAGKQAATGPEQIDRFGHLRGSATGPGATPWSVRARITPRLLNGEVIFEEERRLTFDGAKKAKARLFTNLETPVGPPTWEAGNATVFIPGNFGRGNYCPGVAHGGGPKWGPSDEPETCPSCKVADAPGHVNHWTFAASRIPNPWAVAADRDAGLLAFAGTDPRSCLGESSVGFRSPADGTTTLRLATPITYEPWVPHGYGGFDRAPRRDTRLVEPGESITWRVYYSGKVTRNLNDWLDLDGAMYGLIARWRPAPHKMPFERALAIALNALHTHFYKPDRSAISYSTGPDGQGACVGFTGMSHSALALLVGGTRLGNDAWREAGLRVLDHIAWSFLNGPNGFPFSHWSPAKGWETGGGEPAYVIFMALDNLIEAWEAEHARGVEHDNWRDAARRCCDAFLATQRDDGAFPLKHPAMEPNLYPQADYDATNVTAGVIACLVDARRLWGDADGRLLESARRAAEFYGRLLDDGKLWGGPGDIEALVNSEVPMFYLRSFVRLARATGDDRHRRWARDSAAWRLGFQFAHCWPLALGSQLYQTGWAGLGSENASASNLHSVCFGAVNAPDYALAHRLLGGDFWPERLRDLCDYATQQFGRFDGDGRGILDGPGLGTESWWTTDTRWGRGNVLLLLDKPNLGYMSWTTGWSAYGALHALRMLEEGGG